MSAGFIPARRSQVVGEFPRTPPPSRPIDVIRSRAAVRLGLDAGRLPQKWELIGDVLLLRLPRDLSPRAEDIASIYAEVLGAETVVEDLARIRGPWRVPEVRRIWGGGTETVHVEDGVRFKLDVAKVMFSSGNTGERQRMARIGPPGETVVDLFAGIGHFSLPIAVHARPARVVACEVNPVAFDYLRENGRLNRVTIDARLGDCRAVAPKGIADRVVMGHFDAEKYFDTALEASGDVATIHLHGLTPIRDANTRLEMKRDEFRPPVFAGLEERAEQHGYSVQRTSFHAVKWYGPRRVHFVLDISIARE